MKHFFDSLGGPGCGDLVIVLTAVALLLGLARFLYRRNIFLRL